MKPAAPAWIASLTDALRELAARPWCLFLLLVALNALIRPYGGIVHDARLYSLQVVNHLEGGTYHEDLFLRYGSQDQYSLFSVLAAPAVHLLGVHLGFLLLYLAFNALFLLAIQRFVETVIEDRVISTLSLLFIAVCPLFFGGLGIFQVHEPFLTPRLMAITLTLFGLVAGLNRRWLLAFLLGIGGLILHPLMAFPGLLVLSGLLAFDLLGLRKFMVLAIGLGLAGLTVLAVEPIGLRLFGFMDEEWRTLIRRASPYNFPSEWTWSDWVNNTVALLMVFGGAWAMRGEQPRTAMFLFITASVALSGLLGTWVSSHSYYALLFQGQPYRAMWLVKLLQFPVAFCLAARLWQSGSQVASVTTIVMLAFLFGYTSDGLVLELSLPLFFFPFFVLGYRGLEAAPRRLDWFRRSLAASFLCGLFAWAAFKITLLILFRHQLYEFVDILGFVYRLVGHAGPLFWVALTLTLLALAVRKKLQLGSFVGGCLVLGLAVQLGLFVLSRSEYYQGNFSPDYTDLRFVQKYLEESTGPKTTLPTVYSSLNHVENVWLDWRALSYFNELQVVGVLFSRKTAVEGLRRAELVRNFELGFYQEREHVLSPELRRRVQDLFQTATLQVEPTRADLEKLCRDEAIDFLVLKQGFPGLYSAENGRVFVYDCRKVRAVLGAPSSTQVAVLPSVKVESERAK